jgi:hypothetical protein
MYMQFPWKPYQRIRNSTDHLHPMPPQHRLDGIENGSGGKGSNSRRKDRCTTATDILREIFVHHELHPERREGSDGIKIVKILRV